MTIIQNAISELLEPIDFQQLRGGVIEAGGDVFKESFTKLYSWSGEDSDRWTIVASDRVMLLFRSNELHGLAAYDKAHFTAQDTDLFRRADPRFDEGIL